MLYTLRTLGRRKTTVVSHLKALCLTALCLGLWACAGAPGPQDSDPSAVTAVDSEMRQLPAVSVFFQRPSGEFLSQCREFEQRSVVHHCRFTSPPLEKLRASLDAQGVFAEVRRADDDVPFRLSFSIADFNEETAGEIGNAALSGATLLVLPMRQTKEVRIEARLYWFTQLLSTFELAVEDERSVSLFSLGKDFDTPLANQIAAKVAGVIQAHPELFTAQFLSRKLGATDYSHELKMPQTVGAFQVVGSRQFHHPFLGVQFHYLRPAQFEDAADVFVYPIRQILWQNSAVAIKAELETIREEIGRLLAAEDFLQPKFSEPQVVEGLNTSAAVRFHVDYADALDNHFRSRVVLAIRGDKFVKIRHTGLASDPAAALVADFSRQLLESIEVPGESPFMAEVRRGWAAELSREGAE